MIVRSSVANRQVYETRLETLLLFVCSVVYFQPDAGLSYRLLMDHDVQLLTAAALLTVTTILHVCHVRTLNYILPLGHTTSDCCSARSFPKCDYPSYTKSVLMPAYSSRRSYSLNCKILKTVTRIYQVHGEFSYLVS